MIYRESALQTQTATYLSLQHPQVVFIHVPNEGRRSPQAGARAKRQGVRSGVSDLLIWSPVAGRKPHGLALELKSPTGRLTDSQRDWFADMERVGWITATAKEFEAARRIIDDFVKHGR
jgi:hypothetical protein